MKELIYLSVKELFDGYEKNEFSPSEAVKAYLEHISKNDSEIGAYITVSGNVCIKENSQSRLFGVPYSVKDNILTKDIRTTCASKMLEDFVPPYNASVCEKLESNGAVLLGKTNMDEFAMGSTTENSAIKVTKNPINSLYSPGGSSGGSAASVASFEAAFSLGSDTGGSVCQPASFCGVVGLKPTYGLVSRYGLIGFAPSLDQIGVIARNVYDSALVLSEIAFHDRNDSTSANVECKDYTLGIQSGVTGLKIGVISDFLSDGADRETINAVKNAALLLEKLGADVEEVSMPVLKHATASYIVLSSSEAYSTLSRYDGIRYGYSPSEEENLDALYTLTRSQGFGAEVKRRLLSGSVFLSQECFEKYYRRAEKARLVIIESYEKAFEKYDILLSPVSPTTSGLLGSSSDNAVERFQSDRYTCCANLAYLPSMSVPFSKTKGSLPISVLLCAPKFCENTLFRASFALECEKRGEFA